MNKVFFKAEIKMASPLAVGSGKDEYTDNDVLTDHNGVPYIPGTTLSGVIRHFLEKNGIDVNIIFGFSSKKEDKESEIIIYEAFPIQNSFFKNIRDGVGIDLDTGVAMDTAKFDYEIIEPTGSFLLRIEIDGDEVSDYKQILSLIVKGINSGEIRFGAKTNRGMGKFEVTESKLLECKDIDSLIDFEWDSGSFVSFTAQDIELADKKYKDEEFRIKSFILIANNATLATKDNKVINSEQLTGYYLNDYGKHEKRCVIPGTAWAGVFKHHFYKMLKSVDKAALESVGIKNIKEFLSDIFGSTNAASRLVFDQSDLKINAEGENNPDKATLINSTRNAIDRFTGGASDKMLFTNKLAFGGKVKLSIILKSGLSEEKVTLVDSLIKQTICDIKEGIVNIGGLGGIGGGVLGGAENGEN